MAKDIIDSLSDVNWSAVGQEFRQMIDECSARSDSAYESMFILGIIQNNYSLGNKSHEELFGYLHMIDITSLMWRRFEVIVMWFLGRYLYIRQIPSLTFATDHSNIRERLGFGSTATFAKRLDRSKKLYKLSFALSERHSDLVIQCWMVKWSKYYDLPSTDFHRLVSIIATLSSAITINVTNEAGSWIQPDRQVQFGR